MNPMLILYIAISVVGLIVFWSLINALRRRWRKPFSNPAKLYRQLRRLKGINRQQHRDILEKATTPASTAGTRIPQVDWIKACRLLVELRG